MNLDIPAICGRKPVEIRNLLRRYGSRRHAYPRSHLRLSWLRLFDEDVPGDAYSELVQAGLLETVFTDIGELDQLTEAGETASRGRALKPISPERHRLLVAEVLARAEQLNGEPFWLESITSIGLAGASRQAERAEYPGVELVVTLAPRVEATAVRDRRLVAGVSDGLWSERGSRGPITASGERMMALLGGGRPHIFITVVDHEVNEPLYRLPAAEHDELVRRHEDCHSDRGQRVLAEVECLFGPLPSDMEQTGGHFRIFEQLVRLAVICRRVAAPVASMNPGQCRDNVIAALTEMAGGEELSGCDFWPAMVTLRNAWAVKLAQRLGEGGEVMLTAPDLCALNYSLCHLQPGDGVAEFARAPYRHFGGKREEAKDYNILRDAASIISWVNGTFPDFAARLLSRVAP